MSWDVCLCARGSNNVRDLHFCTFTQNFLSFFLGTFCAFLPVVVQVAFFYLFSFVYLGLHIMFLWPCAPNNVLYRRICTRAFAMCLTALRAHSCAGVLDTLYAAVNSPAGVSSDPGRGPAMAFM